MSHNFDGPYDGPYPERYVNAVCNGQDIHTYRYPKQIRSGMVQRICWICRKVNTVTDEEHGDEVRAMLARIDGRH